MKKSEDQRQKIQDEKYQVIDFFERLERSEKNMEKTEWRIIT